MKMRIVKSVGVADRRDLLSASHSLTALHHDSIEMAVERIDVTRSDSVAIGVAHNNHVAPALMTIARENHHAVSNHRNWIAEIGIASANAVPVFAHVAV